MTLTEIPFFVFPLPELHRLALPFCWALCLAALLTRLSQALITRLALPPHWQQWGWLIGAGAGWIYAPTLALAFVMPSLVLLVWSSHQTLVIWLPDRLKPASFSFDRIPAGLLMLGLLLGYGLVFDTFHIWPTEWLRLSFLLYAWGFEASTLLLISTLWVVWGLLPRQQGGLLQEAWLRVCLSVWLSGLLVLLVFAGLHEPTGNLWDALLDPLVWVACHIGLYQKIRRSQPDACDANLSLVDTHGPEPINALPARPAQSTEAQ
jgi:hypothetical protein